MARWITAGRDMTDRVAKFVWPRPYPSVDEHYRVERILADQLRHSTREERRTRYREVYQSLGRDCQEALSVLEQAAPAKRGAHCASLVAGLTHSHSSVLEFGPGDYSVARALASQVGSVTVLDVADWKAATAIADNVEVQSFNGVDTPAFSGQFDVCFSNQVLEHIHPDDVSAHLRAAHRALRPGGRYLCVTPNRVIGPHDVSRFFDREARGLHLREYTNRELHERFRSNGFSTCRVFLAIGGRKLTPLLPPFVLSWLEPLCARLPRPLARVVGLPLAAVKFVGYA